MNDAEDSYRTQAEVLEVVSKFETCAYAPDDFHHREHLVVALCYLLEADEQAALERLHANLLRFLAHHRVQADVYHETLTLFWLKRVRHFLECAGRGRELAWLANRLLRECGDAHLINLHYSKELLASPEARRQWVKPDRRKLMF
jgi:hypothetical protein